MNDIKKLKEKSSLDKEWLKDAKPKEIGLIIDRNGTLVITAIYWEKPDGNGVYDDENFFSMSKWVAKLEGVVAAIEQSHTVY
jgi:hypothetical protein